MEHGSPEIPGDWQNGGGTSPLRRLLYSEGLRVLGAGLIFSPATGLTGAGVFGALAEFTPWIRITLGSRNSAGLPTTWLKTINNLSFHLLTYQLFNLRKLLPVCRADQ